MAITLPENVRDQLAIKVSINEVPNYHLLMALAENLKK